jgi:hypothetical protein
VFAAPFLKVMGITSFSTTPLSAHSATIQGLPQTVM